MTITPLTLFLWTLAVAGALMVGHAWMTPGTQWFSAIAGGAFLGASLLSVVRRDDE